MSDATSSFDAARSGAEAPRSDAPRGHSAVMSMRAPTDPDDLDYFPTPPWAARAGGELIKRLDPVATSCWEPACGEGHMAHGLADYFERVGCSDIHPYGRGQVFDFLTPDEPGVERPWEWVVSNPPFNRAGDFVRLGLQRATRGVAMLLRSVFREGGGRHRLFTEHPLTINAQFASRVPMVKGRWDPLASSATAYSWFIWCQPGVAPEVQALAVEARRLLGDPTAAFDLIIPPDAKARFSRDGDLKRFGLGGDAGLFDGD